MCLQDHMTSITWQTTQPIPKLIPVVYVTNHKKWIVYNTNAVSFAKGVTFYSMSPSRNLKSTEFKYLKIMEPTTYQYSGDIFEGLNFGNPEIFENINSKQVLFSNEKQLVS